MSNDHIRNFSIIAHIDHGKSTLADRLMDTTGTVAGRDAKAQLLDSMDLERERGVTIKLAPVRMRYEGFEYNLIDTPGHVDFSYEVSRALAAVEGAVLVVDATQGIQAQTLAHFTVARELGLAVVAAVNKIDLPNAQVEEVTKDVAELVGCAPEEVLAISAKTGAGITELLQAIRDRVPPPTGGSDANPRALIFDANFDEFRGVVAFVRVREGTLRKGGVLRLLGTRAESEMLEVGYFAPAYTKAEALHAGDIGYVVTGLKSLADCRVGDTMTLAKTTVEPLPGYREPQPMVFASLYPDPGSGADDASTLRNALEKLRLNDAALQFEGEHSPTFGLGFRCGFLGLFHLEIIQERLRREYNVAPVVTLPMVAYRVTLTNGKSHIVKSAMEFPEAQTLAKVEEPWIHLTALTPPAYLGPLLQLIHERRGTVTGTETVTHHTAGGRMRIMGELPLAVVLTNFYDRLKSRTSGFASMFYELTDYRETDIVRLDILVASEPAEELATLVYRDEVERQGRRTLLALKESLPKAQFEIRLQAAIGGKIIAAERIAPLRKDVTAKLYGGDVTRKMKLLEKQKKGKKRMRSSGRVHLPPEAFLAVVKGDLGE